MLTVVGWPRSGTHWLKAMLEYALKEQLAHAHAHPEIAEGQCVLIVRDPRDAFASRCRVNDGDRSVKRTEIEDLHFFLEGPHQGEPEWRIGWEPYTRKLLALAALFPYRAPLVRHEHLYAAPAGVLARVLTTLGKSDVSNARIEDAVEQTRGKRCDPTNLAEDEDMGRPGKWKAQLQDATVRVLLESCGELMQELGYT